MLRSTDRRHKYVKQAPRFDRNTETKISERNHQQVLLPWRLDSYFSTFLCYGVRGVLYTPTPDVHSLISSSSSTSASTLFLHNTILMHYSSCPTTMRSLNNLLTHSVTKNFVYGLNDDERYFASDAKQGTFDHADLCSSTLSEQLPRKTQNTGRAYNE